MLPGPLPHFARGPGNEASSIQLSSCLDYVEGSLKTGSEGEILAMKTPVLKQIGQLQPIVLTPYYTYVCQIVTNSFVL